MSDSLVEELMQTEAGKQLLKEAERGREKPQMPEASVSNSEIRRLLYKFFPREQVDHNHVESRCPYCGHSGYLSTLKVYHNPKDKDYVGIYTCGSCRKRWVKQTPVHAEVW